MLHIHSHLKPRSRRACLTRPKNHHLDQAEFTRLSTTASASWGVAIARACGFTRNDFADRFPQIAEATSNPPVQSCFMDGETIVVDERGLGRLQCP
jgi:hypothetical protein